MNQKEIEFSKNKIVKSVSVITRAKFVGESSLRRPKPLTIFFKDDPNQVDNAYTKASSRGTTHFPYKKNKMVLWNYNFQLSQ